LRDLFPINDGDVFSREKVAKGLVNLRKAYGSEGYINATFMPTPHVDENERVVSFDIGVDDGKQFYVSSINIIGENEEVLAEATRSLFLKVGQLYNQNLIDLLLEKYSVEASDSTVLHLNEKQGTAHVTVDLRHCQRP
jgi:outer membrane protein insertion porin family